MTRNLKTLGLVLAAVFALSAVAASAAMAQETNPAHFFSHTANEKTHLHGEQVGEEVGEKNVFRFTTEEGGTGYLFHCPNEDVSFTGLPSDTEGNTKQGNTFTDVTVHPVYSPEETHNCPLKIGEMNFGKVQVQTEGCDFVLSAHTDANEQAPVHIVCEPEERIYLTGLICLMFIAPQTPQGGVHYEADGGSTESGEEAILADVTLTDIHVTAPTCQGFPENFEHVDYESTITVKGFEDRAEEEGETKEKQVSITWTEIAE